MRNALAVAGVVLLEMIRRKDVYVLLFLTVLLTLLLGSVNVFSDDRIACYLKEVCLTLIWLCSIVIATVSTARQIPSERESRTIYPLLAKPVSRGQVILGKLLGCWAACCLSLAAFYLFFAILSGAREHVWPITLWLQAFWLHCLFCLVAVALTLLGSLVFSAASANVTITLTTLFAVLALGRHLHKIAARTGGLGGIMLDVAYYAIPHLEWFDLRDLVVHNWPPMPIDVLLIDTLYAASFAGLFLGLAWVRFRRMPLQ